MAIRIWFRVIHTSMTSGRIAMFCTKFHWNMNNGISSWFYINLRAFLGFGPSNEHGYLWYFAWKISYSMQMNFPGIKMFLATRNTVIIVGSRSQCSLFNAWPSVKWLEMSRKNPVRYVKSHPQWSVSHIGCVIYIYIQSEACTKYPVDRHTNYWRCTVKLKNALSRIILDIWSLQHSGNERSNKVKICRRCLGMIWSLFVMKISLTSLSTKYHCKYTNAKMAK